MILQLILLLILTSSHSKSPKSSASLKENDPRHCRCGEAREGEKITPRDIQDWDLTTTTTTTTEVNLKDLFLPSSSYLPSFLYIFLNPIFSRLPNTEML